MRKIGINVSQNVAYGAEAFMESIAKAGFDSVFTVGNDAAFVAYIARKCAQTGLKYEALHAPYLKINDLWFADEKGDAVVETLCKSVDLAKQHGIPIVVMHLSSKENCPHVTDAGLANFDRLHTHAKEQGVILAVENQRKLGNIATILEIYGKDSNVGFCWDVGHEACFANGREYMPLFADRCVMTHIHDNNCRYNIDEHLIPFDGQINFRRTADLIHDADYSGTLMLELDLPHEGSDKYADLSLAQFVSKAYAAINRLRILSE
ncbi:MAG: sugar phosphate isomerase/epimerase [Clostridia bacterium]|nr:sugar phosphate isomerase/epimerase [Clostridia bacterium]